LALPQAKALPLVDRALMQQLDATLPEMGARAVPQNQSLRPSDPLYRAIIQPNGSGSHAVPRAPKIGDNKNFLGLAHQDALL
jgi:hypothetical protein